MPTLALVRMMLSGWTDDALVAAVAPNLQRYISADLG